MAALAVALVAGIALACDTPVYRYAMYRWEPAPYEVYCFHDKPMDEQATKVQKLVEATSRSEEKPANLFFVPVSLSDDPELKRIPPDVRKAWQEQKEPQVPTYMVVTPHGQKLYQGALDEAILKAMLDSPARTEIAKLLGEGKAGVMILVGGSDEAANAGAEKEAKSLIADMAAGNIELYLPPGFGVPPEGDGEATAPGLQLGFVKVTRSDAAEKWLVDSLLSMEKDLTSDEFAAQPMIFAVFGRGRGLPPFVGKGINRDNLLECVYFLTGACSCTVKEQNPGMDLLFAKDWWSAAEKLAADYGAEEGNETQLGAAQLFPHLMIPGGQEAKEAPKEAGGATGEGRDVKPPADAPAPESAAKSEGEPKADAHEESGPKSDTPPTANKTETAHEQPKEQPKPPAKEQAGEAPRAEPKPAAPKPTAPSQAVPAAAPVGQPPQAATAAAHAEAEPAAYGTDAVGVFAVGAGLSVALVLLFGMTFLVLRPK